MAFVPKVHPATRPVEPEDPMTLEAIPVAGDPDLMLRCLVEEYAWMGWDTEEIFRLFRDPSYPVLYSLLRAIGEEKIRDKIQSILGQTAVLRFAGTVREDIEPVEPEPELVELGIRCRAATVRERPHSGGTPEAGRE
jgi:hypothetical protein